ncbi:hypothetical protein CB1_000719032 [Camelus ferus]|nr:hypothetical protein CB1_000719032 [Camelus ferus]
MDLSVLPNNNHPDKFLQLDVKSLMRSSAPGQAGLVRFPGGNYPPAAQHWRNLIYSQICFKSVTTLAIEALGAKPTSAFQKEDDFLVCFSCPVIRHGSVS